MRCFEVKSAEATTEHRPFGADAYVEGSASDDERNSARWRALEGVAIAEPG